MVDDEFSVPAPDPNPLDIAELACKVYLPGDTGKVLGRASTASATNSAGLLRAFRE